MPISFSGNVMKVGNSMAVILPKPLIDNFEIDKGDSLEMIVTDKGIFIPLKAKQSPASKRLEKQLKEIEKQL